MEARARMAAVARTLAWWTVLAVFVLVPLIVANPTILGIGSHPLMVDQVELPKAVALAVLSWLGLAAWAVSEYVAPAGVRWSSSWWALIAFVVLTVISAVLSPFQRVVYLGGWFHYEGLLQWSAYAAAAFVAAQTVTERRLVGLVRFGTVTGAVLAVYGILQALRLDPADWLAVSFPLQRSFSTWGNPDFFGGYLIFPLSFAVAVAMTDEDKRWRIGGFVCLGLVAAALVTTLTRSAWLAGLLVVAVMLAVLVRRGIAGRRVLLVAGSGLVLAVAFAFFANGGLLVRRVLGVFSSGDLGLSGRIGVWQATVPLVFDRPLFGLGPDAFWAAMLARVARVGGLAHQDPHNLPLYLLATLGVPATLAVLGFVAVVLWRSARSAFARDPAPGRVALAAVWCAALVHTVYLLVNVSIVTSTTMLFVCLGLLLASSARKRSLAPAGSAAVAIIAAALLVTSVWLGARGLAADHAYFRARLAIRERTDDRAEWAARAVELNPLNDFYRAELANAERAGQ